ncbi:MAG TPA: glycosyltransferase family 4 protein [Gemmatimonadaceae bacterium]|nr:glycosyltransferase family 4 protein [Gemmatimonadaceae bacterium]
MRRLRVLHLDSGASWRGGQRQVLLLALGLRARGHEPLLIAPPDSPLVRRARGAGLAVASIAMRGDWDVAAARRIRARMRAWRADVIHAHDARAHAIALMALIGQRETPLIVTRRVPFTPKSVRVKYGERVTRFIAVSRAVRDAMVGGGIPPSRIDVVHSGIASRSEPVVPRDWRAELGWPADAVVCGVVGAMTAEKGIDSLVEIAAALSPTAGSRARILLIGGGGASRGPGKISVEIKAAGFIDDVDPAIAGLDVLWHPSRAEGLGTAVIDAMSLGVPPVAFAVGGLPEVIEDEVSGFLVPPANTTAFAKAASRLIEDAALRESVGAAAIARARSFDADTMTLRTESVYQRVLSG